MRGLMFNCGRIFEVQIKPLLKTGDIHHHILFILFPGFAGKEALK
jgi:hypothetical protein